MLCDRVLFSVHAMGGSGVWLVLGARPLALMILLLRKSSDEEGDIVDAFSVERLNDGKELCLGSELLMLKRGDVGPWEAAISILNSARRMQW